MDENKSEKPEKKRKTDRLEEDERGGLPIADGSSFGVRGEEVKTFIQLPIHLSRSGLGGAPMRWRIILDNLGADKAPMGLDILGDIVMGRGKVGPLAPDLDMEPYNAHGLGVSRRHALLRPTVNNLYVIDLGSTNGTFHNGVRLGPGVARVVANNDTLSLGNLSFTVKIVDRPEAKLVKKQEKAKVAEATKPEDTKPFESTPEAIAVGLPTGSPRRFSSGLDDEDDQATIIVRPDASRLPGKRVTGEPSRGEEKEVSKAAEKASDEPKAEAKSPGPKAKEREVKEPEKVPPKDEAKPAPEAEKEEKVKEPEKMPSGAKAEANAEKPEGEKEDKEEKEETKK